MKKTRTQRFRRLSLFVLGLLTMLPAWAGERQTALRLLFQDGTSTCFLLSDEPELSFSDNDLVVTSSSVSTSYPLENVKEYDFVDATEVSVKPLAKDEIRFVRSNNNEILVYGCQPSSVAIYDAAGRRLPGKIRTQSGATSISLHNLPTGVYIVKMNQQSIKISKK